MAYVLDIYIQKITQVFTKIRIKIKEINEFQLLFRRKLGRKEIIEQKEFKDEKGTSMADR